MKKMKKFISFVLCVCMTGYALPVFATQSVDGADLEVQIIMLSDVEMSELIGANGSVDATVSDYTAGDQAEAVIANRSNLYCEYTLAGIDSNGVIVETIMSGTLAPNEAIVARGSVTADLGSTGVQARIWSNGVFGLESKDASMK